MQECVALTLRLARAILGTSESILPVRGTRVTHNDSAKAILKDFSTTFARYLPQFA
jgi:hypothetical protein